MKLEYRYIEILLQIFNYDTLYICGLLYNISMYYKYFLKKKKKVFFLGNLLKLINFVLLIFFVSCRLCYKFFFFTIITELFLYRSRLRFFYKLLHPYSFKYLEKLFSRYMNLINRGLKGSLLKKKFFNYRFWRISFNLYRYLLKHKALIRYFFMGYPSYVEVSYKLYLVVVRCIPTLYRVYYPFSIKKQYFYEYFRHKNYF